MLSDGLSYWEKCAHTGIYFIVFELWKLSISSKLWSVVDLAHGWNPTPQSVGEFFLLFFSPFLAFLLFYTTAAAYSFSLCFIVFNASTTLWCIWSRCSHWIKSLWSTLSIDAEQWFCVSLHFFIAQNFFTEHFFYSTFKYWGKSADISFYIVCAKINRVFSLTNRELSEKEKIQWTKNSFKCIRRRRRWWLWWWLMFLLYIDTLCNHFSSILRVFAILPHSLLFVYMHCALSSPHLLAAVGFVFLLQSAVSFLQSKTNMNAFE